jgi:hypothetical protein
MEERVAALFRAVYCLGGEIRRQRGEIRALREAIDRQQKTPATRKVLGTAKVAGLIGRGPDYVREHAEQLGGWKENGPGSRWRFDPDEAVERSRRGRDSGREGE